MKKLLKRNNLDQASTNDAVHETRDNEITAINKIQPEAIKKLNRNKQSMMLLQLKSSNDQVSDATQEEKDAAKAKVDEEVTKAKSAIDKANTNNDVDQAKTNGTTIISSIEPEAIKKLRRNKPSMWQCQLRNKKLIIMKMLYKKKKMLLKQK